MKREEAPPIDRSEHPELIFLENDPYFYALFNPEKNLITIYSATNEVAFARTLIHELAHWASYMGLDDFELQLFMSKRSEKITSGIYDIFYDISEKMADWVAEDVDF
jgi:hypothetical protein